MTLHTLGIGRKTMSCSCQFRPSIPLRGTSVPAHALSFATRPCMLGLTQRHLNPMRQKRKHCLRASNPDRLSSSNPTTTTQPSSVPKTAREAIERGQASFDRADYTEALRLFQAALNLSPNEDEARAALYNSACAHARLKNWQDAAEGVVKAVNEYSLKLEVAVKVRRSPACLCCLFFITHAGSP
jgi:tetratricopeptide (TPR) repeat protein